jgi:hypothetical protein
MRDANQVLGKEVFGHDQELVIEPGRSGRHYWRDLWQYRELFQILAWRDISVRYKQPRSAATIWQPHRHWCASVKKTTGTISHESADFWCTDGRMDLSVMKYLPTNFTYHELDVRDRCRFEINCETHHVEWHLV